MKTARMKWMAPAMLAVAIATVGSLAWFLGRVPGSGYDALAASRNQPAPEAHAAPALVAVEPLARASTAPLRATPAASTAPASSQPAPDPALVIEPAPASGQRVRVLRGRGDEAVAFAVIRYAVAPLPDAASRLLERAQGGDVSDQIEHGGRYFQADAEGYAIVPVPERVATLSCDHEGAWGTTNLWGWRPTEVCELRVFPDAPFRVRVVRAGEREPVEGATVAIRYETAPRYSETLVTKKTAADGEVTFARTRQYSRYYWPHTEELAVALAGIYAQDVAERIEPEELPELVELELPPSSTLEVIVVDASGRASEQPVLVRVDRAGDDAFDDSGRTVAALAEGGRALFRQIGLGLELAIRVESLETLKAEPVTARSAGEPGGRTTVHVTLGSPRSVLVGRVLDADGTPLADARVRLWLASGSSKSVSSLVTGTDAQGAFRYPVPSSRAKLEQLVLSLASQANGATGAPAQLGQWHVAGPLPPGDTRLGDLRLEPQVPLLSGWVRDRDGNGVSGARVRVSLSRSSAPTPSIPSVASGEDGAFAVYGPPHDGTAFATASHPGYSRSKGASHATGTTGVELLLDGAGRIAGSVVFDEEWFSDFAVIGARTAGDDEYRFHEEPDRAGHFTLDSLPPGRWTVCVGMEGDLEHGVLVEDVEVVVGETTRDPRLQGLDLRDKVRIMRLEVVDVDGKPVEEGEIRPSRPGALTWAEGTWFEEGEGHLFTFLEQPDLLVTAPGMRDELVPRAVSGQRIVLRSGIEACFSWSEQPPSPLPGRRVRVMLEPLPSELPRSRTYVAVGAPDESPNAAVIRSPGDYNVVFLLEHRVGKRRTTTREVNGGIHLLDAAGVQEFTIRMPEKVRTFLTE